MSITNEKSIVMRLYVQDGAFYISNRHNGITLDEENYLPYIVSVGSVTKYGNFGEGQQVGTVNVQIMNGEEWHQGNYIYDVTKVWNNRKVEIKLCDVGTDTTWAACEWYHKGILKNLRIQNNNFSFDVQDSDFRDFKILPFYSTEEWASIVGVSSDNIPDDFKGKRIPMQYGNLNDKNDGVFGKGVTISNKIGNQRIYFDFTVLKVLNEIGIWENGLKKFFTGNKTNSILSPKIIKEYEINSNNHAKFYVDTTTQLDADIVDTVQGFSLITVKDYTKILWIDETDDSAERDELLSINIIAIDNELMLVSEKPDSNSVLVERGYNSTTIATHSEGATIYQTASFSGKNALSFTEKFEAATSANHSITTVESTGELTFTDYDGNIVENVNNAIRAQSDGTGKISNSTDSNTTSYMEFWNKVDVGGVITVNNGYALFTCDMKFNKIEDDIKTIGWYHGHKFDFDMTLNKDIGVPGSSIDSFPVTLFSTYRPDITTTPTTDPSPAGTSIKHYEYSFGDEEDFTLTHTYTINNYNTLDRSVGDFQGVTQVSTLLDLNNKWKIAFYNKLSSNDDNENITLVGNVKLYNYSFWIDFYLDFTKRTIMAPIEGRVNNSVVTSVTGGSIELSENPVDVVVYLLYEAGYTNSSSFDTTKFQTVYTYYESTLSPQGNTAFSYGLDDKEEAWKLAQQVGRDFNLALLKNDSGQVDIVNLHQLQSTDGGTGYPSLTAYQISLDDLIIPSDRRMIDLQQTGTDRLRNNIEIRYKRNNSTDEYQAIYPSADDTPDSYTLIESGITLEQARINYNNGEKTELMVIESPFIYNSTDAQRLWEWQINDKAEVHFWVEFTIEYNHYTNKNSKSEQYEIGDIIYLDGIYAGVTFDSTHKWYIVDTIKKDQGREFEIHAKSIEPISEFTSSAVGQNDEWQNTTDTGDQWQNTTDTGTQWQNKI